MTDPQGKAPQDLQKTLQTLLERMLQMEDRMDALVERMGRLTRSTEPAPPPAPASRPAASPGMDVFPPPPAPPPVAPRIPVAPVIKEEEPDSDAEAVAAIIVPESPPASEAPPAPAAPVVPAPPSAPPASPTLPAARPATPQPQQTPPAPAPPAARQAAAPVAPPPRTAAPPPPPPPATAPAKVPAGSTGSLEQTIGLRWMLLAGLGVMILGTVFFYQYAVTQGWINERVRLAVGALVGLGMIGVGEWAFRRGLRSWAAAVIGGGIVLLYSVVFLASPNGPEAYRLLHSTIAAFALMCLVTLIGVVMSLRTSLLVTGVVALIGALATPVLLSTGENRQVELLTYLLAVDAGFLLVALLKRWPVLATLAMVGTVGLFGGWFTKFYEFGPTIWTTTTFAWAFFVLFAGYATVAGVLRRLSTNAAIALSAVAAFLLGVLAVQTCDSPECRWGFCLQLAALEALTLLAAYLIRGPMLAPFILLSSVLLFGAWYGDLCRFDPMTDAVTTLAWLHAGLFFGFVVAQRRRGQDHGDLLGSLALLAAGAAGSALLVAWKAGGADWRWPFCMQLALLEAATLAIVFHLRRPVLAGFLLLGAAVLLATWYVSLYWSSPMTDAVTALAWLHAGMYAAWALAEHRRGCREPLLGAVLLAASAVSGGVLLAAWRQAGVDGRWAFCMQVALLEALTLAAGWPLRRPLVPTVTLIGASALFAAWYVPLYRFAPATDAVLTLAWLHVAMFVLTAVAERRRGSGDDLSGVLIIASAVVGGRAMVAACTLLGLWPLLAVQVLVLAVILLATAAWLDWPALSLLTLLTAHNVVLGWFAHYYQADAVVPVSLYCWAVAALAGGAALLVRRDNWNWFHAGNVGLVAAVSVVAWAAMRDHLAPSAFLGQVLAMDLLVLGFCWIRDWTPLRPVLLVWTAAAVFVVWRRCPLEAWLIAPWAWTFLGVFAGDLLARAMRGRREGVAQVEAAMAAAATAMAYWITYRVLHLPYEAWMGGYTAALGAAALAVGVLLLLRFAKGVLARAYIAQGLVLLTMAVPIQFEFSATTIAWAAQAVVASVLARRLRSWMLLLKAPIVLALAGGHYLLIELPRDPTVQRVVASPLGVVIPYSLVLAVALTAAMLAMAAILRRCRLLGDREEGLLAAVLALAGTTLFFWRTASDLPLLAATWWWTAYASAALAVGAWRRSSRLVALGLGLLALATAKWMFMDTLVTAMDDRYGDDLVVLNWQAGAGVTLAILLLWGRSVLKRAAAALDGALAWMQHVWFPLAALLLLWAGSFEIDRYFELPFGRRLANRQQAMQMAYSIWWSLCAVGCLVAGFALTHAVLRYLALAVFGVTLVKVFLVDLRHVHAVFRILSFMALGLLLLAGSYLYHVRLRRSPAQSAPPDPPQPPASSEDPASRE
ncbi:MAG TPA: DUF2339 domain-containing protein [Phycisphaerae bacterium]|nr:DUF2339 domain-containing protein [Phycisphaerae bacterium]